MRPTFNDYLVIKLFEDMAGITEASLIDILVALKKEITFLLKEDKELKQEEIARYLRVIAAFEQFFRYMSAKRVDLTGIPGLKALVDKNDIEHANEETLESDIDKIIEMYSESHTSNFKHAVEKRFKDFCNWFQARKKDELQIVKDAVDFTISSIEKYKHDVRFA